MEGLILLKMEKLIWRILEIGFKKSLIFSLSTVYNLSRSGFYIVGATLERNTVLENLYFSCILAPSKSQNVYPTETPKVKIHTNKL